MGAVPIFLCAAGVFGAAPGWLEDRFEMPAGFRIYKAAGPDLTGGSYDLAFDGEGRLLVGDGTQVRRLEDRDLDGIFDASEVIARGLGPRGPQGLLVWGDRLYAVGGDGIQLFEGYRSGGPLVHRGRIGERLGTGGDHDAHQIQRGHDGHLYFIAGDGSGTRDRRHITEETSPCLFERSCSVFRIHPDGKRWECVGSGGRNAPNLGINYLGEMFSLDSDMEWHVDLPWWRPVRLHHWVWGGDQGWQDVGAYPPYFIDNLPGILDVGRGSPDWGVVYEHTALPARYHDAYLVCDYQSKSATTGGYETSGRLFAFFLERAGAGWKASMEVLARPKPGARDEAGRSIHFAIVDLEVAPDGSLLLSDHNQGVWRILHDPAGSFTDRAPVMVPAWPAVVPGMADLLALPQPGSEWSRLREEEIRKTLGSDCDRLLREAALTKQEPLRRRLRALRLLSPGFAGLPQGFIEGLARDAAPELRGQAAWLLGLRGGPVAVSLLLSLIEDSDAFVRRRAAEALARLAALEAVPALIEKLRDPVRLVRYLAMVALSHQPQKSWLERAVREPDLPARLRALVACQLRREPPPAGLVVQILGSLVERASPSDPKEDRLDLLRALGLFGSTLRGDETAAALVSAFLVAGFPDPDPEVRRELARLLGEYRVPAGFGKLLAALEGEKDPVAQFHLAQALARIPRGWSESEEDRAVAWCLGTQAGWFARFEGKGLQFREFLSTVLSEFARHHPQALLRRFSEIDLASVLGGAAVDLLAEGEAKAGPLVALYRAHSSSPSERAQRRILSALGRIEDPKAAEFLREEYLRLEGSEARGAILQSLARAPRQNLNVPLLLEGLLHRDPDVVRACARGLDGHPVQLDERTAGILLGRLIDRRDLFRQIEGLLARSSGVRRPGFDPERRRDERGRDQRPEDPERREAAEFWRGWYSERFGKAFDPALAQAAPEKEDEEVRDFLLSERARGGDAGRGRKLYEAARCAACHGGVEGKTQGIFGPELAGVTRRLSREEIADALVFPSKQVSDRFKAKVVMVRGGAPLVGFITEETDEAVTLVDQERVHRVPRKSIARIAAQEASLMPERLLNRLSWDEIRDLAAFLEEVGARPEPPKGAGGGQ